MTQDDHDTDNELPSKTALKRAATEAQSLGKRLTELKPEQLSALPLPDNLRSAIEDYQRFPSHGAKRRQLQFIGKLMRDADLDAMAQMIDQLDGQTAQAKYEFAQLEKWRDELLSSGDAMTRFIDAHPNVDRQQLRQLVKKATSAKDEDAARNASRALFRFLRDVEHEAQA